MKRLIVVLCAFVGICVAIYISTNRIDMPKGGMEVAKTADMQLNKVYLFTKKGCPYCTQAVSYIKQNHPDFQIEILDILESETNRNMAIACANRFGIPLNRLGTPLICMPDDVILGWGGDAPKHFDDYVKNHPQQGK